MLLLKQQISADDRAGNDLADVACRLVVLEHRDPANIRVARHSANLAVTCKALVLRDSVWTLIRLGFLGEGERSQPSSDVQGAFARSATTKSARHAVGAQAPQAPERTGQCYKSGLTALRAHRIVDHLQGRQGGLSALRRVWFVRWSCSATASAQQLPWCSDSWETDVAPGAHFFPALTQLLVAAAGLRDVFC